MAKVRDCGHEVSKFKLKSYYYIHFWLMSSKKVLTPSAMDQIVLLLLFYKDGFGSKQPTKVDMLINKETKLSQIKWIFTYIEKTKWLFWFGWLWHINHGRLFNAKSCLYIYHHCHHAAPLAWISDPFSSLFFIVHCFQQVFRATSCIGTELYVGSSWLSCLCSSMRRGQQEHVTYEFVQCPACLVRLTWIVFAMGGR